MKTLRELYHQTRLVIKRSTQHLGSHLFRTVLIQRLITTSPSLGGETFFIKQLSFYPRIKIEKSYMKTFTILQNSFLGVLVTTANCIIHWFLNGSLFYILFTVKNVIGFDKIFCSRSLLNYLYSKPTTFKLSPQNRFNILLVTLLTADWSSEMKILRTKIFFFKPQHR